MRVGYVEVVVVLLYEIVSINVHLMLDAFFVSFHCTVYFLTSHLQIGHSSVSFFLSLNSSFFLS